jgi:hypothetical protein
LQRKGLDLREIQTRVLIDSSPAVVWGILTDLRNYPAWNPFIPEAVGEVTPGAALRILIRPPGEPAQKYRVRVLAVEPERRFRWLGHFHVPGLIDGDHVFEIHSSAPGRTEVVQRETFRGVLVPLVWKSFLDTKLRAGFEALNGSLKAAAERAAKAGGSVG